MFEFADHPDAKRYLGTFLCAVYIIFMIFQVSVFTSWGWFFWFPIIPMILTVGLLFLEQLRGRKMITLIRGVAWFAWSVFAAVLIVRSIAQMATKPEYRSQHCERNHVCTGPNPFEAVAVEIELFIFFFPYIFATATSVFMVWMTKREYQAPAGTEDSGYNSVSEPSVGSSGGTGYYTL